VRGRVSLIYDETKNAVHLRATLPAAPRNPTYRRVLEWKEAVDDGRLPDPSVTVIDFGSRALATTITYSMQGRIIRAQRFSQSNSFYRLHRQLDRKQSELDSMLRRQPTPVPWKGSSADHSGAILQQHFRSQVAGHQRHILLKRASIHNKATDAHYRVASTVLLDAAVVVAPRLNSQKSLRGDDLGPMAKRLLSAQRLPRLSDVLDEKQRSCYPHCVVLSKAEAGRRGVSEMCDLWSQRTICKTDRRWVCEWNVVGTQRLHVADAGTATPSVRPRYTSATSAER